MELTIRVVVRADSLGPLRVTLANGAVRHLPLYVPRVDSATKAGASAASGSVSGTERCAGAAPAQCKYLNAFGRPDNPIRRKWRFSAGRIASGVSGDRPYGNRLRAVGECHQRTFVRAEHRECDAPSRSESRSSDFSRGSRRCPSRVIREPTGAEAQAGSSLVRTTRHLPLTSRFCSACESFRE